MVKKTCDHIHAGKHSSELFCDAAVEYLIQLAEKMNLFKDANVAFYREDVEKRATERYAPGARH